MTSMNDLIRHAAGYKQPAVQDASTASEAREGVSTETPQPIPRGNAGAGAGTGAQWLNSETDMNATIRRAAGWQH